MLLAGRTVTGLEALDHGLATHLVELDAIDDQTDQLARTLAEGSPQALRTTKHWLNELEGLLDETTLMKGADLSAEVLAGAEAQSRLRGRFGSS
jgi:enoyl-CoA hydratase/carnithine racemase